MEKNGQVFLSANLSRSTGKGMILKGGLLYPQTKIGKGYIIGHNSIVRENCEIGEYFKIWNNSVVDYYCKIGNNVKIHCNCYIAQKTIIEDDVFIAPGVVIANDLHPGCVNSRKCMMGATLKKGCQIGCNATILPGVLIGENSIIGAGSVVIHDVPSDSVVCGNPAKVIKKISELHCPEGKGYVKSAMPTL